MLEAVFSYIGDRDFLSVLLWVLDRVLLPGLIVVSVVAIYFVHRALDNLEKENDVLHTLSDKSEIGIDKIEKFIEAFNKDEVKDEKSNEIIKDPYDAIVGCFRTQFDSSAIVQKEICGNEVLHTSYVSDRLYAILSNVSTENLVRKAPPLEDLHELTIQREQGGIATAMFRMLSPSILVLGILGTLLGVHQQLDFVEEKGATVLTQALLPGALAVLSTVVVMGYRGKYNRLLSRFIADFNEYTLRRLLPVFRPISQKQADIENVFNAIKKVQSLQNSIAEMNPCLKRYKRSIDDYKRESCSILSEVQKGVKTFYEVISLIISILCTSNAWYREKLKRQADIVKSGNQLAKLLSQYQSCLSDWEQSVNEIEGSYRSNMDTAINYWNDCSKFMVSGNSETHVSKYDLSLINDKTLPDLFSLKEELKACLKGWEMYVTTAKSIEQSDKAIDDVSGKELPDYVNKYKEHCKVVYEVYGELRKNSEKRKNDFCSTIQKNVISQLNQLNINNLEWNLKNTLDLKGEKMTFKIFEVNRILLRLLLVLIVIWSVELLILWLFFK